VSDPRSAIAARRAIYVPSGDRRLWTQCIGEENGEPILFVAGANASGLMWLDECLELFTSAGVRAIRYDHRDTGKSTFRRFEEFPYTVEDLGRDAIAVLDGWGIEESHLVGLSLGATIGQVLALDYPQRLKSLTLMCGAALDVDFVGNIARALSGESSPDGSPLPGKDVLEALAQRGRRVQTLDEALEGRIKEWKLLCGHAISFDADEFRAWERRSIEHAGTWELPGNHAFAKPVPRDRGRELRRATVQTLVNQGTEDPLNPPPHGKHVADLMPSAHLVEIDGLGHALPGCFQRRIAEEIIGHAKQRHTVDAYASPG
jgi:pimeloyl-ACP methyl ester carboxylesterase